MKELESHSSEVNRVKDKLVRVRSSKLNFFKKYRNLSKLNQRLKERIIKRNETMRMITEEMKICNFK